MHARPSSPRCPPLFGTLLGTLLGVGFVTVSPSAGLAQGPDRVLVRTLDEGIDGRLSTDRGATGVWQKLQKLRTTGSVLYTAGHPDDEEPGVLTLLSRGMGARTALLTLNRGEGGANAIGPELFDALGLIRSEELRLAGRYYGLDDQYFTTAVDYGYSKTLDEAMRSWDREAVLGDMVRVIRTNRPLVVISRWHGSERDGHGHHQAAGVLTPEAVDAAADPARFPDQISVEGLRAWRVPKVYRGRLLEGEPHDLELNPYVSSPWLGSTYQAVGSHAMSLQRSQTSGRQRGGRGSGPPARYERLYPSGDDPETALFDGLDTTLQGVGVLSGEVVPRDAAASLRRASRAIDDAVTSFDIADLGPVADHLVLALRELRRARSGISRDTDVDFLLAVKERQLTDALADAAGLSLTARAVPAGEGPTAAMGSAVPGQALDVHIDFGQPATTSVSLVSLRLQSTEGWPVVAWVAPNPIALVSPFSRTLPLEIPAAAAPTRDWFHRPDIRMNQYLVRDSAQIHLGEDTPPVTVEAAVDVGGERIHLVVPVRTTEMNAPYGALQRTLVVAPAITLQVAPGVVVRRPGLTTFRVAVDVTSNAPNDVTTAVQLVLPTTWASNPTRHEISFDGAGQTSTVTFELTIPPAGSITVGGQKVFAEALVGSRSYREGAQVIEHRDLGTRRLYQDAALTVAPIDVEVLAGLRVGYVMGVGDDIPAALEQLGASVELLGETALGGAELATYDAIFVGTRAYAVRPDLVASNARLLDFARNGGNLVVLYQTLEYTPERQAPYLASLPDNAQEVSEEDAAVRILGPQHPLLTTPNRIGSGDFEGWIEQRGSKFFESWAPEYTALIETHDTGQPAQEGAWLTARVGEGHFTYVALALQRQTPYGVPGAYRILANLLALGH